MAKVKSQRGRRGYLFFKELGGAPARTGLSKTARVLLARGFIRGRVLDYGCGRGFDAQHEGWDAYDPYYAPAPVAGPYDTIVVNHVANILTRASREKLYQTVNALLGAGGVAYFSVARNIPERGKAGLRQRIGNYVVLTLPTVFVDGEEEIYWLDKDAAFADVTCEFESWARR